MNSNNIPNFPRKKVYFEKQQKDRLCGVHCLNVLVQAPLFDPFQLSEIALRLDTEEKKLYDNNFVHKDSSNVDDDGNYNIQVLSEALKKHGTEIVPLKNSEAVKLLEKDMDNLEAFIFNSSTHWYTIRRIDKIWFNLNSTNSLPEIISDFYLSAYIKGSEQIGYTNFLVKKLPKLLPLDAMVYTNLSPQQSLISIEDIVNSKKANDQRLRDIEKNKNRDKVKEDEEKEEEEDKNKFKAFTGKGVQMGEQGKYSYII